jgi:hypothetical protein
MALALNDRVQQQGTANTTVSFTLTSTVLGFQDFTVVGNGNTTYYAATDVTGNWEVGVGTYSSTGPTLTRTTILSSSNSGSAVTFSGDVNVWVTYPSDKSVNLDGTGNVSALGTVASGTWQGTTIGVAYGGTGVTASSGANSVVLRDANGNVTGVNNAAIGITFTTASSGITTLVASSTQIQTLVGSADHTFKLPDATTLIPGLFYTLANASSGTLTVQDNAGTVIETIAQGGAAQALCLSTATSAGTWGFRVFAASNVTWGNANLDYNGTITSATWQGTPVAYNYGGTGLTTFTDANYALYSTSASALTAGTLPIAAGGTGQTTATAAFNALSPITSTGDLVIGNGTNSATRLGIGTNGYVLTSTGSTAIWQENLAGAQAGGVIYENNLVISSNYTLTTGKSGMSVGPITINSGVSVTVPSGQRWVVL